MATAQSHADDETQIIALMDRKVAAVNARDMDALMQVYADDIFAFDLVPPRQYIGRADYREDWETLLTMKSYDYWITDLSVTTDGTLGFSRCINHTRGAAPDGTAYELVTRATHAFRKTGGQWFMVMEHVSVPVDPLTGKADFTSAP